MSDEQKYAILGLNEYIRQGEPQQRERSEAWKVAIGLQQVDRLQTSEYLLDTAKRHIEGDISIIEAKQLIDSYYKSAFGRKVIENDRTEEADKLAARITELIEKRRNTWRDSFAVCCLERNMTLGTGLCTLIGTKLRTKLYPKVQITKFKVQKLAKNYPQSAKIALWKKSLYFA